MLNVLLGQGNDKLTITGTLDPATESYTPVTYTGALDIAPSARHEHDLVHADAARRHELGAGGATRRDFVLGQQVLLSGVAGDVARRRQSPAACSRSSAAQARRRSRTQTNVVKTVSVPGPHGGLTVVHGGGNFGALAERAVDVAASSLTRRDGLSWLDDGYQIGQRISIAGSTTTWADHRLRRRDLRRSADPFARCGKGATMLLSGATLTAATNVKRTVSVVDAQKVAATGSMTLGTSSVTRDRPGWTAASAPAWTSSSPACRARGRSLRSPATRST